MRRKGNLIMSMDYIKAFVVGVDFKELQPPPTAQHIFAEVVLIDKSHEEAFPLLYQFDQSNLGRAELEHMTVRGFTPIHDNAFTVLGNVESVDRAKKKIRLTSHLSPEVPIATTTVSYNHLIVVSANDQKTDEFSIALMALLEALKVRKHVPTTSSNFQPKKEKQILGKEALPMREIEGIVKSKMLDSKASFAPSLSQSIKKLYEFQVGS